MAAWERRKILIWGKTRPELSRSHKETVCTGGVFADTKGFVRLYPIPLRYLDEQLVFKKYQWIEASVRKAVKDSRPESYNIRCDDIKVGEVLPTDRGNWHRRAEWITQPDNHIFQSVEALQAARERDGTSLGMIKPLRVTDYRVEAYTAEERQQFWTKYQTILSQQEFSFDPDLDRSTRPLPAPAFRFQLQFRCDDSACTQDHIFSVFDWEVDALYNRLRQKGDSPEQACEKTLSKLRDEVCGPEADTYFFLGNIAAHPHKFTIVGLWYPRRQPPAERDLFSDLSEPISSDPPSPAQRQLSDDFVSLVREWKATRGHASSVTKMAKNPAYERIIAMGEPAIPLILTELRREPDHWFPALHAITGANPIPTESRGKLGEMMKAWLDWGKEHGYIE
jgi:hypothetical protein